MTFVDIFGGPNVNPAQLNYAAYSFATDLVLQWPFEAANGDFVCADKLGLTPAGAGLSVFLPPANQVSVGQDTMVLNFGADTLTVKNAAGATIGSVASGQVWYFYLRDNTSPGGIWGAFQLGIGTSNASAASLAGAGLRALGAVLQQDLVTTPLLSSYVVTINDRARVLVNNNGSVTWSFQACVTLGNGFFVYVINAGSGTVTLDPNASETIDGSSSKVLAPGESCAVFCDGTALHTLGYGRSVSSTVTGVAINAAGSGLLSLNGTQVAAQVQDYTGTLTGNRRVEYGTGVGYWFISNGTSGAFSLTLATDGLDGGVIIPQGTFSIVRSNGTSMEVAFSATSGTVTSVGTGTGLTGGPITTTGTISMTNTTVVPGTYGNAASYTMISVDAQGRLTAASHGAIDIPLTQIQVFSSATFAGRLTDETGTGVVVFSNAPTINDLTMTGTPVAPTPPTSDNDTSVATTAFVKAAIADALAGKGFFTTGDIKISLNPVVVAGVNLLLDGKTIGNAASGATARANADTQPLYIFMWNTFSNSLCPVSGGRGANAASDFAANKTLALLDGRGLAFVMAENMGGTNRGNVGGNPSAGGVAGTFSLGVQGGAKDHTQTLGELIGHTHSPQLTFDGFGSSGLAAGSAGGGGAYYGFATTSAGGGSPFNITQPSLAIIGLVYL